MKTQRLLLILTVLNAGLLACQILLFPIANAASGDGILRGTGFEIVDKDGRLRAQLKVEPENAAYEMPDGTKGYPETVIFRLITSDGKPRVKLTTSTHSSGLMLLGEKDTTQTILEAKGTRTALKLRNDETTQHLVRP